MLAKIDVDANPRLVEAFQAKSVPMIAAIIERAHMAPAVSRPVAIATVSDYVGMSGTDRAAATR